MANIQAFSSFVDTQSSPKATQKSKLLGILHTAELHLVDNISPNPTLYSTIDKVLPNLRLSNTFEFTRANHQNTKRGHSSLTFQRRQPKKLDSLSNFQFTTLDLGPSQDSKPIFLNSKLSPQLKPKYRKLDEKDRISLSPRRLRTTKHSAIQPFKPLDPEVSMVIRPAYITHVLSRERVRLLTAATSANRTMEIRFPSMQC